MTKLRRLGMCGRVARSKHVGIRVEETDEGPWAHAEGLMTCGSIWACPVCAVHIRVERGIEIGEAVSRHRDNGGGLAFVTLTLRHGRDDDLGALLDLLYGSWRKVQQRRDWRAPGGPQSRPGIKARLGVTGWIRAAEITYGVNGWHPHLHLLLFTSAPMTHEQRDELDTWLTTSWIGTLRRAGGDGVEGIAVDVRRVEDDAKSWERLAGYTAKAEAVHLEVARGDAKKPRAGESWGAWSILEVAAQGERWALMRWWEYERETHGRRAIEWSRGLREDLGLGPERSDDEIVSDTGEGEIVALIEAKDWRAICAAGLDCVVLEAAEDHGAEGVAVVVAEAVARARDGP